MQSNQSFNIQVIIKLQYAIVDMRFFVISIMAVFCMCDSVGFAQNVQLNSIADSIVKYQLPCGGWVKNQEWNKRVDIKYIEQCRTTGIGATIDNGATYSEMRLLAEVYAATGCAQYKESFIRGLHYLLSAQYANGGWPQYFPARGKGHYSSHITFNDGAMTGVIRLMRDIFLLRHPYCLLNLSDTLVASAKQAYEKGIECILNCQIVINGKTTVWCQQHDSINLLPAQGRAYELPSFSGHGETADILNLLMDIDNPTKQVIRSVEAGVSWLIDHEMKDVAPEHFINNEGQPDIRLVRSEGARGLWARFYDLENAEPFFCGRDGIPQRYIGDIDYERRMGYSWFGNSPAKVIERYEEWRLRNLF